MPYDELSGLLGRLSTRPEKYLGSIELWNEAENALESLLNEQTDLNWTYNHGDGGKWYIYIQHLKSRHLVSIYPSIYIYICIYLYILYGMNRWLQT